MPGSEGKKRASESRGTESARPRGRGDDKTGPVNGRPEPTVTQASAGGASGQPMMDLEFLRGLIDAVDGSGIDSIEITRAGTRIRISKTPAPGVPAVSAVPQLAAAAPVPAVHVPAPAAAAAAPAPEATPPAAAPEPRSGLLEIKSPMVGTFYRAPAPEAPSYVEIGSHVAPGQTLCILEAMKLMNELESEVEGVVREILVENTEPVEFGQVLFRIEPTKKG